MARMDVGRDAGGAAFLEPVDECEGRLGGNSLSLPRNAHDPRDLGTSVAVRTCHRRLHGSNCGAGRSEAHDPVQPGLLTVGGASDRKSAIAMPQIREGRGMASREFVEAFVAKHPCHFISVVRPKGSELETLADERRACIYFVHGRAPLSAG